MHVLCRELQKEYFCLVAEENGFSLPGPPSDMPPPPAPDGFDLPAPPPLSGDENFEGRKMPKQNSFPRAVWLLASIYSKICFLN